MTDTAGQTTDLGGDAGALDDHIKAFDAAKTERYQFESDWFLNLSYFVGDQWVFWNRDRLDRPNVDRRKRVLLVDNRIVGIVSSRVARKTKSRPTYVATPMTQDDSDTTGALMAEKVLESDWLDLDMLRKLYEALFWQELCTAGFWKVYYDKTKGSAETFVSGPDGRLVSDDYGRPIKRSQQQGELPEGYTEETIHAGEACVDVVSPFQLFPDPLATSMEDCHRMTEERVRSTQYVEDRWNFKAKPDADAAMDIASARTIGSTGPTIGKPNAKADGVKVYEQHIRPCGKYPKGYRIVWCNDKVLERDDAPFDPMPYVMFPGTIVPGRFWPTCVTNSLRGPQSELNKMKSQIREAANRLGNPALLWSRFAGKVTYQGVPGEVIKYDDTTPNSTPKFLQPPEVPNYVQNEVERIEQSLEEISGMHEVSKATVPSGVTAASAINLLQESDDTRLSPEIALMERALAEAGTKQLKIHAQFDTTNKLIRIAGEDGDWDIFEFRGALLGDNTNVEVQGGSMMPRSKAAKQAAMTEIFGLAMQYGVPLDRRNVRRFFADYEVGGLDRLFADISADESQITWENQQLSRGIAVPINDFDDDSLHIQGHTEHQKSSRWRRLDRQAQQIYNMHVLAHRERRVEMVDRQVATKSAEANARANQQAQRDAAVRGAGQNASTNSSS